MFDVLVYVYEHFWRGDACPELPLLSRKLSAAGFEADEIQQALDWLAGLSLASNHTQWIDVSETAQTVHAPRSASAQSMRVYTFAEQQQLGADCLGFLQFLEDAGKLSTQMREVVIDRAMAVSYQPVTLDDLKIIVLMVYWRVGLEPDALILDELCDAPDRVAH